jgi:hypothetical protein
VRAEAVNLGASARDIDAVMEWPVGWAAGSSKGTMKAVAVQSRSTLAFSARPAGAGDALVRVRFRSGGYQTLREHPVRVVARDRRLVLFSGFLGCPVQSDRIIEVVSMPANYALRRPRVFDDLLPQADLIITSDQHDAMFPPDQVDAMIRFVEGGGKLLLYCCWSAPWGRGFFDTFGSIGGSRLAEVLPLRMRKGITHARRVGLTEEGKSIFDAVAWETIPAFDHNDCDARQGARILASSGEGAPLIAEWGVGRGRVMTISIDCFGFESYVEGLSFDFWPGKRQMLRAAVEALLA